MLFHGQLHLHAPIGPSCWPGSKTRDRPPLVARRFTSIRRTIAERIQATMETGEEKLTPNQARFVAEYLIDLNATQAAIRAGYSTRTASVQGCRLLRNAQVAASIRAGQQRAAERTDIAEGRVLKELKFIAFSNISHYRVDAAGNVSLSPEAQPGAIAALASVKSRHRTDRRGTTHEVELKLWDKVGALELAGRHVGLFTDQALVRIARRLVAEATAKAEAELKLTGSMNCSPT